MFDIGHAQLSYIRMRNASSGTWRVGGARGPDLGGICGGGGRVLGDRPCLRMRGARRFLPEDAPPSPSVARSPGRGRSLAGGVRPLGRGGGGRPILALRALELVGLRPSRRRGPGLQSEAESLPKGLEPAQRDRRHRRAVPGGAGGALRRRGRTESHLGRRLDDFLPLFRRPRFSRENGRPSAPRGLRPRLRPRPGGDAAPRAGLSRSLLGRGRSGSPGGVGSLVCGPSVSGGAEKNRRRGTARPGKVNFKSLGYQEAGYSVVFVLAVAAGYR